MNKTNMKLDETAQVGIGTMIVFIATILVAAVAAGVLIDTSQKLQGKSTQTGTDAVKSISSALQIESVYGYERDTADAVDEVHVLVSLGSGASAVDLKDLVIQYHDGTQLLEYKWGNTVGSTATDQNVVSAGSPAVYADFEDDLNWDDFKFWINPVRDSDESAVDLGDDDTFNDHDNAGGGVNEDTYDGVMNDDDLIEIVFGPKDESGGVGDAFDDLGLGAAASVSISLLSAEGISTQIAFKTPTSMVGPTFWELA